MPDCSQLEHFLHPVAQGQGLDNHSVPAKVPLP